MHTNIALYSIETCTQHIKVMGTCALPKFNLQASAHKMLGSHQGGSFHEPHQIVSRLGSFLKRALMASMPLFGAAKSTQYPPSPLDMIDALTFRGQYSSESWSPS